MSRKKIERIGLQSKSKQGLTMQIVKYYGNKNVVVSFLETGETKRCRYDQFVKGNVKATQFPIGKKHIIFAAIAWFIIAVTAVSLLIIGIKSLFF